MPEQLTFYHDKVQTSPFCFRVAIALLECGASYTEQLIDVFNKPTWFAKVSPVTGKIPAITYGGPVVSPEEPSELSFKLAESIVILDFLADLYPESSLLPPASNPVGRARVRFFVDATTRGLDMNVLQLAQGNSQMTGKIVEGLENIQALLPDPDAPNSGEFAIGKDFTIADCAVVPFLAFLDVICRTDVGKFEPGTGTKLGETLAGEKFERLRRYKKALWERESVKKVADLDRYVTLWRALIKSMTP